MKKKDRSAYLANLIRRIDSSALETGDVEENYENFRDLAKSLGIKADAEKTVRFLFGLCPSAGWKKG